MSERWVEKGLQATDTEDAVFKLYLSSVKKKAPKTQPTENLQHKGENSSFDDPVRSFTALRLIYKTEKTMKLTRFLLAYERIV